ncbi:unnamed protein product [Rotaria socialis]|uniref:Uncharacterized protein n=1 Tax=Rotaria socialis TaxID=392032 RepID=A0A817RI73_9BILA|nr:unnamed protein product [Rotaria socialis]CAF3554227.1 unnamed protein product [Rotaria socialis]
MKSYCIFAVLAFLLFSNARASPLKANDVDIGQKLIPQERMLSEALAVVVSKTTAILGPVVAPFVACMGTSFTLKCSHKMLECAIRGTAAWQCIGGLMCGGKSTLGCIKSPF